MALSGLTVNNGRDANRPAGAARISFSRELTPRRSRSHITLDGDRFAARARTHPAGRRTNHQSAAIRAR